MTDLSSGTTQLLSIAKGREDTDSAETAEWLETLDAVVAHVGKERAQYLFDRLAEHALSVGVGIRAGARDALREHHFSFATASLSGQSRCRGKACRRHALECARDGRARQSRLRRTRRAYRELCVGGGFVRSRLQSFLSCGECRQWRRPRVFPSRIHRPASMHARSWKAFSTKSICVIIDARLRDRALCSYPHPWLMPDFWQFPTGSMGTGPINSI